MSDFIRQIDEMIEKSQRGELKTSRICALEPPDVGSGDPWDHRINRSLTGHARQRAIVAYLRTTCLTVKQICEASGFTDAAVRHHLWFLEQQAKNRKP